ncbi:hypothetical protein F5883DRAFT_99172 [Diaporthe sp. PMI_573]|nr:hypothetical protein F5883DRAFT_99172 [Diaporthaceae sp. PMI_573]
MPPRCFLIMLATWHPATLALGRPVRSGWLRAVMPAWHVPSATAISRTLEFECRTVCAKRWPSSHSMPASGTEWRGRSEFQSFMPGRPGNDQSFTRDGSRENALLDHAIGRSLEPPRGMGRGTKNKKSVLVGFDHTVSCETTEICSL